MSTPANDTTHQQTSGTIPAAESVSHSTGVGVEAPAFNISGGDGGVKEEDRELADKYIEDLGGAEAIDDAFFPGFAEEFAEAAAHFETSWHKLDSYDLTSDDKAHAYQDHQTGKEAIDSLIGHISAVVDAGEDADPAYLEEMQEETMKQFDRVENCTDLQNAYIKLFEAVKSKDHMKIANMFLLLMKGYDYLEMHKKLLALESDTQKLKKMVDDANRKFQKEGSDVLVDLALIGLEGTILTALGVTNPVLGGIIILSLAYGVKGAKDSIIKAPNGPEEPLSSVILTQTDQSLDFMVKGMEASGKASEAFVETTGKLGKFKNGLGIAMGTAKTYEAYADLEAIDAFYKTFESNAKTLTAEIQKDYKARVEMTGKAGIELYKAGLEIGPTIDSAISDINYYRSELYDIE